MPRSVPARWFASQRWNPLPATARRGVTGERTPVRPHPPGFSFRSHEYGGRQLLDVLAQGNVVLMIGGSSATPALRWRRTRTLRKAIRPDSGLDCVGSDRR